MAKISLPTRTILIVEHDDITLFAYSRILRLDGYRVHSAGSTEAGLLEVNRRRPDAVVLGLHWPDVDPLEFVWRLRTNPRHRRTPVAVVTGDFFLEDGVATALRDLGAKIRFKPMWHADLSPLVGELLDVNSVRQGGARAAEGG